jgi:lysyl-tRNA synthetase class 2
MSDGPAKLSEQVQVRRQKLASLRSHGFQYPNDFRPDAKAGDLHLAYDDWDHDRLDDAGVEVRIAGRLMAHRVMGKSSFGHLQDESGRMQVFFARDVLGEEAYAESKRLDLGDIIGVCGSLFRTRTGELTVKATSFCLISKCLHPMPEKWHGLHDKEIRYRQRYLDLIVNAHVKETFRTRSRIVSVLRRQLEDSGFIEVETPMLQPQPGGAAARPFVTHHNALDMDLYLRIAPELYLKRLLVGGFERVFEINRNFRNEGLDATHNPEFTMVEFYQAYADYQEAMDTTERLIRGIANELGRDKLEWDGVEIDLSKPFRRLRLDEAVFEKRPDLRGHANNKGLLATVCLQEIENFKPHISWKAGHYLNALFEELVEPDIGSPCFITHFPVDVSPLARRNPQEPTVVDRFELIVAGKEIANGFSELNDPDDQRERFVEQMMARKAGDLEAPPLDEDYLCALEYGMAPAAGVGIGVDRLVMMFTGMHSIRDVLFFPHMRPA